jgi:predicted nucleic acid-binding protein
MDAPRFLDTNIFVYSFDSSAAAKRRRAQELISKALRERNAIISYQVIQEFLNVARRRFEKPMAIGSARAYLERVLLPLCEVLPDARLYSEALSIHEETGWSFYDALIVGSAVVGGCTTLLTEDLQHERIVRGVEIQNPFL